MKSVTTPGRRPGKGWSQLTLVEHALCPLDSSTGSDADAGFTHRSEFFYVDPSRHLRKAAAAVVCPFGLSPADEFYLWGLVALGLSQPEPSIEFYATPHYCLSELGVIDGSGGGGGKSYALFRQAMTRLAAVTYINDRFFDPVRSEHRAVAFGFLSYSLPHDPRSSRAWRIVWDPIFFEFCQASRGSLVFDLDLYRSLDFASRRLFLLLKKIFYRNAVSPAFDVRHLGVNVLGFSPTIEIWNLKSKIAQVARRLADHGLITLPSATSGTKGLFTKTGVGAYAIRFDRGEFFAAKPADASASLPSRSAMHAPLTAIGFDEATIARIIARYRPQLVQVWADITIAAKDRGPGFFKVSPQAYFMDNIEKASQGTRTPPDWWHDHRKQMRRADREATAEPRVSPATKANRLEEFLRNDGKAMFDDLVNRFRRQFETEGHPPREALRNAHDMAKDHMRSRLLAQDAAPTPSLGTILERFSFPSS